MKKWWLVKYGGQYEKRKVIVIMEEVMLVNDKERKQLFTVRQNGYWAMGMAIIASDNFFSIPI